MNKHTSAKAAFAVREAAGGARHLNPAQREEAARALFADYRAGLMAQSALGLARDIPCFVRFYEGHQWAPPTARTKNLPRPVVNIVKMICRNKQAALLSTPVRLVFSANRGVDIEKFNAFATFAQKDLGQADLDRRAVRDGVLKGTYIYHYFWDPDATDFSGRPVGALRGEILDPLQVFFADPSKTDEQRQAYILIATRVPFEALAADPGTDLSAVTPDGDGFVTVLTRYFRIGGEVYCERGTENLLLREPFPIAPSGAGASGRPRAPLYPVAVGNYEPREGSIYGLGEVEGILPNQKAVNFNLAMALLNAQEVAWGKYVVLPGALKGQTVSNEPGQVLVDHSGTGEGIRRLPEVPISEAPFTLVNTLTALTRTVTGSSEVMTGEVLSSGLSGAAIAQLQSQASLPMAELREAFFRVKEKQGRILAQFLRLFYRARLFPRPDGGEPDVFDGEAFADTDFSVRVQAVTGAHSSTAGDIAVLDTLLRAGRISADAYIRAYPDEALTDKTRLLAVLSPAGGPAANTGADTAENTAENTAGRAGDSTKARAGTVRKRGQAQKEALHES